MGSCDGSALISSADMGSQLVWSPDLALEARMVQTYHAEEVSAYSDAVGSDEESWYAGSE